MKYKKKRLLTLLAFEVLGSFQQAEKYMNSLQQNNIIICNLPYCEIYN